MEKPDSPIIPANLIDLGIISPETYKRVVETSNEGIWIMDEFCRTTYVNQKMANMLACNAEDPIGHPVEDWMFDSDHSAHYLEMQNRKQLQHGFYERRFRRKDGSELWALVSATPITDSEGNFRGSFGMFTDITERNAIEKRRRENEAIYRRIIETANEGMWGMDENNQIILVNQKIADSMGYQVNDFIGKTPEDFIAAEDIADSLQKLQERRLGKRDSFIRQLRRKDDTIMWARISATPLYSEGNEYKGSFAMISDISEQHRVEEIQKASLQRYQRQREAMRKVSTSSFITEGDLNNLARLITKEAAIALEVERLSVWLFESDYTSLVCIDEYTHSTDHHITGMRLDEDTYKNEFSYLKQAQYVDANDPYQDIRTSGYIESYLKPNNISSMLDAAIRSSGKNLGLVCCEHVGKPHSWEQDEISFCCQLADQLALCLSNQQLNQVAKSLRESEERTRLLLELAPTGIAVHTDGIVVYCNPACAKIMGAASVDELLHHNIREYVEPGQWDAAEHRMKRMVAGEADLYPAEYSFVRLDGSVMPVEVVATPLLYHGKPSIQIIITDITNRKLAEENIRSNEARLKSIVNILQYNTESPQDFLSYALEEAVNLTDSKYGYIFHYDSARQEFVNVNFSRQALKDTNIEHKPKIFPLAETGIWGEVVRQNRSIILNDFQAYHPLKKGHPPGHVKLTKFMSIPIIDSGRIIAVVGMANKAIDYTETDVLQLTLLMDSVWKMAENKKRDAEIRKFYRAVEQSPVSIVITDVSGIIEYANDFLCKITGFTPAELLGSHTRILKSNETPAEVYQDLWKTILAGKTWSGELRNRKKNGELYWEDASISPVLNQDGKIINFIGVKEDITQRKEMTNRLMRAMAEAEQMNKLKSNFLANMSHELRTPLVGILGYSELLPSMIDDPDAVDMVNTIHVSGKRLLNTLNMVLDLSRIEADRQEIRWETVELNNLLQTIMHLFSINAQKKKLSLSYQTFADEIKFKTDSYLIEHIVNDLINNAIKYTQSGGVLVETRLDRTSAEARLQIVVTDTGIGIPPDQLEIIFDAFRQASEGYGRSFEGTGLGLTITKKYVELLGGEISVTSELGKGSCFTISFPADYLRQTGQDFTATLVDASIPGTGNPSPIMSKQTVLLIDDDEISHMLVSNMLRDVVKIESATTGFEAMEKIKHRVYPAILLDINLRTGLSGLDVVSMIRQIPAYHNVPVVAVTAFTMLGDKEKFLASGCTHYLSKPFSQQELRSVIHDILG